MKAAGERLIPMLKVHRLGERWIEIANPNQSDKPKVVKRKGYWIHVDGALGAAYMPFLHMAYKQGHTTIKPPPMFVLSPPCVPALINSPGLHGQLEFLWPKQVSKFSHQQL